MPNTTANVQNLSIRADTFSTKRAESLRATLPLKNSMIVIGPEEAVAALRQGAAAHFIPLDSHTLQTDATSPSDVLLVSPHASHWDTVTTLVKQHRNMTVWVLWNYEDLVKNGGELLNIVAAHLRHVGRVYLRVHRLAWTDFERPEHGTVETRVERLHAETRELLVETALACDPDTVWKLADRLLSLQADLDIYAQLEIEHARTREAEAARVVRLGLTERRLHRAESLIAAQTSGPIGSKQAMRALAAALKRRLVR